MATQTAEYARLGKSGLRVSVPILGTMSIGTPKWNAWCVEEDKAFEILQAAWDSGVTTWDTANMYSNGATEQIIGNFITKKKIPRHRLVLATKIRFLVDEEDPSTVTSYFKPELKDTRDYVNQGGLSRSAIFNQVNASLARLQTDYIDILMIHMNDTETPFEETMQALNDLVRSGKVRYLGASNTRAWQFIEMNHVAEKNGWTGFSCVQMEHSLLYRTEELELFAYCDYKGIGIMAYCPLMNGFLTRPLGAETERSKQDAFASMKKIRDCDAEIIKRVGDLAAKKQWTMAQVALAWSKAKISSPVIGAGKPEHVLSAIVKGKTLTDEEIKSLEEPYLPQPVRF